MINNLKHESRNLAKKTASAKERPLLVCLLIVFVEADRQRSYRLKSTIFRVHESRVDAAGLRIKDAPFDLWKNCPKINNQNTHIFACLASSDKIYSIGVFLR